MLASKWHDYYQRNLLPWDTHRPSTQLVRFLSSCPADLISHPQDAVLDCSRWTTSPAADLAPPPSYPCSPHPPHAPAPNSFYHLCDRCAHLKPPLHARCLELACGTGASCVHMAQSPLQGCVVGVDIVPEAVDSARRRAREAGVQASCAFVQADVFSLLPSASSDQQGQQGEGEEAWAWRPPGRWHRSRSRPPDVAAAALPMKQRGRQKAFHALRSVDEAGYVRLLRASLRPGGLLLLLTGNANEPEVGPSALTKEELLAAFSPPNWQWLFLLQTRFDSTPAYERLGQLPLAWWGMLRRL